MSTTLSIPSESLRTDDAEGQRHRRQKGWLAALLLRLHFYAGILVGPFILIAASSGALYAIAPSLEQVVYKHELHVPISSAQLSLADQIDAARNYVGGDESNTLSAVRPAPEPGDTTRVMFQVDGLGESESRAVFVDPGSGEIRGDMTVYGTSGALPLRTWIDHLHRNLHLGDVGRLYSELAASWLGIVALAGLVLWGVRIRKTRRKREMVFVNLKRTGYRRVFGMHASLGVWVLLGALFLSATGITWSQHAGANVSQLRSALDWGTPSVTTDLSGDETSVDEHAEHHGAHSHDAPTGAANPATFDAVLAIAQRINVNTGLVEIKPPASPGTAWVVQEIHRSYPTEVDAVAVDGTTMEVVDRVDFADFPLAAKLSRWGIDIHMGSMFGLANQIVLFLVAVGIGTMVVLGYLMWWKRRPTREPRRLLGAPPRRGILRGAPWWGVATAGVVAVMIGFMLPLVGYTLAGFIALDIVIGALRSLRAKRASPPA
ncbi:membrane protein [Microbacterium sorbitolivorans]|uniref:PepSY domain-containing protein n=1 Tax=Microbacterium sorbitolivorans TaxID=1867410 RepID=A0A367XU14_9MICO|nr:PepSY-associated TM helix domain-containing protein [Microbacterium sorbitolivorans]RCK57116.1 PepSY domain-containing protein [Microbacterium sorbitolivorans]GGF46549.1 membrane protein [Microbacterium sorbitolivorans]